MCLCLNNKQIENIIIIIGNQGRSIAIQPKSAKNHNKPKTRIRIAHVGNRPQHLHVFSFAFAMLY
jgi:hypothetical protein